MTAGLDSSKVKWLTYLVYILLTLGMAIIARQQYQIGNLQETRVSTEQYRCDVDRLESSIGKVGDKLDRLIERQLPHRSGGL